MHRTKSVACCRNAAFWNLLKWLEVVLELRKLLVWSTRNSFLPSVLIAMDLASAENDVIDSASSISISRSSPGTTLSLRGRPSYSLIGSLINNGDRRSARLSTKSPLQRSSSSAQASFHWTISGGIASSHSPRPSTRKRISGSADTRGILVNPSNRSTNTRSNAGDNSNTTDQGPLPSDQSDDDEMPSGDNLAIKRKDMGLATRSEILSYYSVEANGYKCKLCSKVSLSRFTSCGRAPNTEGTCVMRFCELHEWGEYQSTPRTFEHASFSPTHRAPYRSFDCSSVFSFVRFIKLAEWAMLICGSI